MPLKRELFLITIISQMFIIRSALFFFFNILLIGVASAQPPQIKLKANLKPYIAKYSEEAVRQMAEFKIPASVILAQAIFESASGTSDLAKRANNHFGIKCHIDWCCDTIVKTDDTLNECFRKYLTVSESYRDHSLFLLNRERYAPLFSYSISDYKAWCYGLKALGYATYPTYAEDLIKVIEDEKLYELDRSIILKRNKPEFANIGIQPEVKASPLHIKNIDLKDLLKSGYLWLDERDVLIQSLDMVVGVNDAEEEGLADN